MPVECACQGRPPGVMPEELSLEPELNVEC